MIKTLTLSLFVFMPLLANAGWDQEPTSFVGVSLGQPITQLPKCEVGANNSFSLCYGVAYQGHVEIKNIKSIGIYVKTTDAEVINGSVQAIYLVIDHYNDQKMMALLTEKFGQPHKADISNLQTIGGAKFDGHIWQWNGKDVSISFVEYADSLDESMIKVYKNNSESLKANSQKLEAQKYKDAL